MTSLCQFKKAVNDARTYYSAVEWPDMQKSRSLLADVVVVLSEVDPAVGVGWLEDEIASIYQPTTVADYQFPLNLLEFSLRSLRWKEGIKLLETVFDKSGDASTKLQIEVIIKRLYDPDWPRGDHTFSELEPSIWDLIEVQGGS